MTQTQRIHGTAGEIIAFLQSQPQGISVTVEIPVAAANGAMGVDAAPKPIRRERALTEAQLHIKEQYDVLYATNDNRLDPVMREIQAQSVYSEDEW